MLLAAAPVGAEFRVNTSTIGDQRQAAAAADGTGNYVVVWSSMFNGDKDGIYAQRYGFGGTPLGSEFRVDTYPKGLKASPAVAMNAHGDFVVAWQSLEQDEDGADIYAQRFDATGAMIGGEFRSNATTTGYQTMPSIGIDADGGFAIAWLNSDPSSPDRIRVQRFDASGAPQGPESRVDDALSYQNPASPVVGMAPTGEFVVAWTSDQYNANGDIRALRFAPDGTPRGQRFTVNSTLQASENMPVIAVRGDGSFIVAWESTTSYLYLQRYLADGAPDGSQIGVPGSLQARDPRVATLSDGGFVVAWDGMQDGSGQGIYALNYTAAGVPDGDPFRVNTTTAQSQLAPTVAAGPDGRFLIAWQSPGQDGSGMGVYAQQYHLVTPATLGGRVWMDSNGDGIRGADESAQAGVEIHLYKASGAILGVTSTDAQGLYRIDRVLPQEGCYLEFVAPKGYVFSRAHQGADNVLDSDVDPITGLTGPLAIAEGQIDLNWDAGVTRPGAIAGTVYLDADTSGARASGEMGLGGWTVFIDADRNGELDADERFVITDSTGVYSFANLTPGSYAVAQKPVTGWMVPTARTVVVSPGQTLSGMDLGNSAPDIASATGPVGPEFRVNAYTKDNQRDPVIATAPNGDFVVVWASQKQDNYDYGIYAQRYNAAGIPQGSEFRVNSTTYGAQTNPSVAMDAQGAFVIAWQSAGQDGSGYGIYAQRYSATGAKLGSEFRVNTITLGDQETPSVAMDSAGNFAIAWTSHYLDGSSSVYLQRYDSTGAIRGDWIVVDAKLGGSQSFPAAAVDAAGNLVVLWQSRSDTVQAIYAQRFNAADQPLAPAFAIHIVAAGTLDHPALAVRPDGGFLATWTAYDGNAYNILSRSYDAAGQPLTEASPVNASSLGIWSDSAVSLTSDGGFAVAWASINPSDSTTDIYVQQYSSTGVKRGNATRVNTTTTGTQSMPAIAQSASGFVAVWASNGQDGPGYGVYAQRYVCSADPITVTGRAWTDLNANGVQDPDEPGKDGVRVDAYNAAGAFIGSTITTGGGLYRLDGLYRGESLYLQFAGLRNQFTPQDVGGNEALDSDVSPVDGRTALITALAGQSEIRLDAGFYGLQTVGGQVFVDMNGNGVLDSGEPGRDGVTVELWNSTNGRVATAVTANGGRYQLQELRHGQEYYLRFLTSSGMNLTLGNQGADDFIDSDPDPVTGRTLSIKAIAGTTDLSWSAGVYTPATVSGTIFGDADSDGIRGSHEVTLPGWIVYGDLNANGQFDAGEPSAVSNYCGNYSLSGLPPGNRQVGVVPQGRWTQTTPPAQLTMNVVSGQQLAGFDIGNHTAVPVTYSAATGVQTQLAGSSANVQDVLPAMAGNAKGDYVIVWSGASADLKQVGIFAQRLDGSGQRVGEAFFVSSGAGALQSNPAVMMDDAGGFAITWQSSQQNEPGIGIYARRYDATGAALGPEFCANVVTVGDQTTPAIAMNGAGDFAIVWQSYVPGGSGVFARRYSAAAQPVSGEFRVDNTVASNKPNPAAAMDSVGNLVIAWQGSDSKGANTGIYARRYGPDGNPLGNEFQVAKGDQTYPAVAMDPDGDCIIAWRDGSIGGVSVQRYNAAGVMQGGPVQVGSGVGAAWTQPAVAINRQGDYVITWYTAAGIYARRYNAAGLAESPEFRVNTTTGSHSDSVIGMDSQGAFVIGWLEWDSVYRTDLWIQSYRTFPDSASVKGRIWNDADGNGIWDTGESPRANVTVKLLNDCGALVDTAITQPDGTYQFDNWPAGVAYHIEVVPHPGTALTAAHRGADDTLDSDVDPTTRQSALFTLAPDQSDMSIDAGLTPASSISGVIFQDFDADGLRDPGEPGIPNQIVYLDFDSDGQRDPGEVVRCTDASGTYSFGDLSPISYRIAIQPQVHWTSTTPASAFNVILSSGQTLTALNLGLHTDAPIYPIVPAGTEFHATSLTSYECQSDAAMDVNGNTVITWMTAVPSSDYSYDVFAQRLDSQGRKVGTTFRINSITAGDQSSPAIAMDGSGRFTIVWSSASSSGQSSIYARRYSVAGMPLGSEIHVSNQTDGNTGSPDVAMDADGDFVVTWSAIDPGGDGTEVYAQRYNASGQKQGPEFRVNTFTQGKSSMFAGDQGFPSVAMDADGDFVIAWQGNGQDGSGFGIYAQRYNSAGVPQGGEFRVNTTTESDQLNPQAVMDADGNFLITWASGVWNGSTFSVLAQRYDASGNALGGELRIDSAVDSLPAAAMDAAGNAAITYRTSSDGICVRRFNAAGLPLDNGFRANTLIGSQQSEPTVAIGAQGTIIVAWTSSDKQNNPRGIYARQFQAAVSPDPVFRGSADSDGFYLARAGDSAVLYSGDGPSGAPLFYCPLANLNTVTLAGQAGSDLLTLSFDQGDPIPAGGLAIDGGNFTVISQGSSVTGYALTARNGAVVDLGAGQNLTALTLSDSARVRLGAAGLLRVSELSLSPNAVLDLGGGSLIISATPATRDAVLQQVTEAIKAGSANNWTGKGITSSKAQSDATHHTGLAVLLNDRGDNTPILKTFNGVNVNVNDILVKYTWNGDVNLDSVVDAADYFLVDRGFLTQQGQYRNGDLNLDGVVDAGDYFLIDSAFIAQTGVLAARESASQTASAESSAQGPAKNLLAELFSTKPLLEG